MSDSQRYKGTKAEGTKKKNQKPRHLLAGSEELFVFCLGMVFAIFLPGCKDVTEPVNYTYKVINTYPHDPSAFTEGLLWKDGFLYEGTGLDSSLRKVDLKTGKVLQNYNLPAQYFGEGITIFNDVIVQLTYKSRIGFVYDRKTFKLLNQFTYPTEGWGLTNNGKDLIMSDGTDTLYFLDPKTFKILSHINVTDNGRPVFLINELEYIQGKIYANIWKSDTIVIISPGTGKVVGKIDLKGLLTVEQRQRADVLNGIAYDAENKRLFVTGKLWPSLFEIKLIPR